MSGHVFITRGDLTKLHCDAWLLPCDAAFRVTPGWCASVSQGVCDRLDGLVHGSTPVPAEWGDSGERVLELADWPATAGEPRPYLVNVGAVAGTPGEWYLKGVRQFFDLAIAQLPPPGRRVTSCWGRPKALVGVPLVGTGQGGAQGIKGEMLLGLLTVLYDAAKTSDVDIVLVTRGQPAFVAAQNARRQAQDRNGGGVEKRWPELDEGLATAAASLAAHAAKEHLVLFLGAGVSVGAGLPTWEGLLDQLAGDAGVDASHLESLKKLHLLDQARIVKARLATKGVPVGKAIADRLGSKHYALAHSLLAALPVSEVATMNYDTLFEEASAAAGRVAAILPYEPVGQHSRWLLKLHGSVTRPDDIVLTREDYLRYADRREALKGIVQALLITRHMLFVGFSLTDDNFQQIIDDVRKAIRGEEAPPDPPVPFGTALLLERHDLLEELWEDDLHLVCVAGREQMPRQDAGRRLEIFLDYLLAETMSQASPPLLDPDYDGILTDEERAIRRLLKVMMESTTVEICGSAAWRPIAELLRKLGDKSPPDELEPARRGGVPRPQRHGQ